MADITLSDGREITFDLYKVSRKEYANLFDKKTTPAYETEIISRVAGITIDEMDNLPLPDWRKLALAFYKKAREPISDPS